MSATVLLQDIIDALQMQFDEMSNYLDLDTGQVETISLDLLSKAEESPDDEPDLLEWEEADWETAKRIVSTDRFKPLPSKYDAHDWSIMQDFARSLPDGRVRDDLVNALHRSGAFRAFKDTIHRHRIENDWYAFRDAALKDIAIEWCEEHKIVWR